MRLYERGKRGPQLFRRGTPEKGVTFAEEGKASVVDLKRQHRRFLYLELFYNFRERDRVSGLFL